MANNFNDNANKKNLNGSNISYTTYRTNYSNDEMMKENGGVPSSGGGGGGGTLTPTPPSWIDLTDETTIKTSIIPSGVSCPLIFQPWAGNAYLEILVGDGETTVDSLITEAVGFHETVQVQNDLFYYGESVEFFTSQPK